MNATLVFIGGTGRCGSTMLLRHLAAHPNVHAIARETNPNPNPHMAQEWCDTYLARAIGRAEKKGATHIVEKSPMSALYPLELIHRMETLTGYRSYYVHIARDRERTLESMERFGGKPWPYTGRCPGTMGERWTDRWREETRMFIDWVNYRGRACAESDDRCLYVSFDDLIVRPQSIRRITDHAGLPWDDDWLHSLEFNECKSVHIP